MSKTLLKFNYTQKTRKSQVFCKLFDTYVTIKAYLPSLPVDYSFVSSIKFFYYEDQEIDIIRRVKEGEKILVFVDTLDKLQRLRDRLKAEAYEISNQQHQQRRGESEDEVCLKGGGCR